MVTFKQSQSGPVDASESPYAVWKPFDLDNVSLNGGFWSQKQTVNHNESLHHAFEMLEKAGNFHNLRVAAGLIEGKYRGRNFIDSDVYKWLEAVAWELNREPDPQLQDMADQAIALVTDAQCPDGYLNSYYQIAEPEARWVDLDHGHELYCAGHLFQAAVAFQRAVGDSRLIEVACHFADHICSTFGPDKRHGTCGHPEVEMALIELYRTTNERRYLDMATFFIDQRGQRKMVGYGPYGSEYHQDHLPVREVTEAVGHTVRQLYLASGVIDLYLETGEQALFDAMQRMWQDITANKLYITGGVGARFDGEAFGDPYELPPDQCYCEACSAIANLMWNWRMLLASGEGRYADALERSLYNNILASPALDGRHFFYNNPLMLREARFLRLSSNPPPSEEFVPIERPQWHDVACCPPNVMRVLASLAHYLATCDENGVQIHQYASSEIAGEFTSRRRVELHITTNYPWQGQIKLQITATDDKPWALSLRVPEWSQHPRLLVNAQAIDTPSPQKSYIVLERNWQVGDVVDLDLMMEPVLIAPNPRVEATRASVAIQRGPIVYCLEDRDQEVEGRLLDVEIDKSQHLQAVWNEDLLDGVIVVEAAGQFAEMESWQGRLYQPVSSLPSQSAQASRLVAVPYYTWGNRGIGGMRVWIPES
jgi:uncharacterized protein